MWTDLVAWFQSAAGVRLLDGAIVPFIAIVVAGLIAGLVVRSAVRGAARRAQRDVATAVVVAVAEAARRAAAADGRPAKERLADDQFTAEAELRLRLLPLPGADLAADWVGVAIDDLRSADAQEDRVARADLDGIRDRLVRWLRAPNQARRLFPAHAAPRPALPRPNPATVKGSKREGRRRSSAVDVPAGAIESAALPISGPASPTGPAAAQPTTAAATAPPSALQPFDPAASALDDAEPIDGSLVDPAAPSTSPVPIARHIAPASVNPPPAEQPDADPFVDHRSSRQADEDDDADFMHGSDQQGPPPVTAIPIRETAPARS